MALPTSADERPLSFIVRLFVSQSLRQVGSTRVKQRSRQDINLQPIEANRSAVHDIWWIYVLYVSQTYCIDGSKCGKFLLNLIMI